jgi:G3E family GTPase
VIVNEFGEIGLDHHLVRHTDEHTMLLSNGCVCCSMRDDLANALRDLWSKRERGAIPHFRRVLIETTGLADPVPLLHTLQVDPVVRHHFRVERVIATVDAVSGATNLLTYAESVKQVAAADHVVITKHDLAPDAVADLSAQVQHLNPWATVGIADLEALLGLPPLARGPVTTMQAALRHHTLGNDHLQSMEIATLNLVLEHPLNWQMFGIWLTLLLHRHGHQVLRVKGLLNVGASGPIVVQGVQHVIHTPQHMDVWPDADHRSRIVFIVRALDPAQIQASLAAFQRIANKA